MNEMLCQRAEYQWIKAFTAAIARGEMIGIFNHPLLPGRLCVVDFGSTPCRLETHFT